MPSTTNQPLPSSAELPCSDDIPVDNVGRRTSRSEDQNLLPNLLLLLLTHLWADRMDWYFGVDMGVYHTTGVNPRVPEVGLGIGCYRGQVGGLEREILTWFDGQGQRHLNPEEEERQRTLQERQRAERLEAYLRTQGLDPDALPE